MHRPSPPDPAITRRLAERALAAGGAADPVADAVADTVADTVAEMAGDRSTSVAWPTIDVLPATVEALLAAGPTDAATLAAGIDLAASLMRLDLPTGDKTAAIERHVEIVARLVPTLLAAGVTAMPGALNHTLSAATGHGVTSVPDGGST